MLRVLKSHSASERIGSALAFVQSFPPATEMLLVGASREAIDDLVRAFAAATGATFGLHRFSLNQLAARLAVSRLADLGIAPSTHLGSEALAVRAAFEARHHSELRYFE